jgi:threonine aldolase
LSIIAKDKSLTVIDFRSDTLTRPTAAMRQAMAAAEVGDDVYGEDPTVRAIEARTADLLGKEAALFVPSGTMGNQLAIRCQTEPGDEVLLHEASHIARYERGAYALLSGVTLRLLGGEGGLLAPEAVRSAARPAHSAAYGLHPPTRLLALENTHNAGGGTVWPMDRLLAVASAGRDLGLALHLDGARLWNAAAALGVAPAAIAAPFDTVSVCFSKGLGAPVGSALAGSAELVDKARRFRGLFGGAMRQAGIIAAGALFGLEHHRERLVEDHRLARALAEGLSGLAGFGVTVERVESNIVMADVEGIDAAALAAGAANEGLLFLGFGPSRLRFVTHLDLPAGAVERALEVLSRVVLALHVECARVPADVS